MADDANLQARIAELAGRINRRRNRQPPPAPAPPPYRINRWTPYTRPRFTNKVLINNKDAPPQDTNSSTPIATTQSHQPVQRPRSSQVAVHEVKPVTKRTIEIEGLAFEVKEDGSKLTRLDDNNKHKTPRRILVAGVVFLRSKNGNLLRQSTQKAANSTATPTRPQCENFTKNGTCSFGPKCRFAHDPDKVAICKTFLRHGTCSNGEHCDFSHKMTYHRVPACHHFQRSACTNKDCRFPHVHVTPGAPVCRPFATLGYCEQGTKCESRHVFECPDYANTGACTNKKCPLPHVLHAAHERAVAQSSEDDSEVDDDGENGQAESEDLYETLVSAGSKEAAMQLANNDDYIALD